MANQTPRMCALPKCPEIAAHYMKNERHGRFFTPMCAKHAVRAQLYGWAVNDRNVLVPLGQKVE